MALASGARIGPYEILAPLGSGGMGEVYRARDTRLGRDVAIKAISDGFAEDAERVARFRREAQMLAALNHPNIAAIHGLEDAGAAQFLVLELVDGESLAARLEQGPLPVAEAIPIALQIADALEAAHDKGIIHRDLKPANVMLTPDGGVKVLDFGLAKPFEDDARSDVSRSPTLSIAATQAGVLLGTAAYMSPEQAKGRPTDKRTDIWAFGCVLYEMLAGKRAFAGEDVSEILAAVIRGEPDWTALPADVPASVRRVFEGCLAKDRNARIAHCAVVRYVLTEPAGSAPPAATRGRASRAIAAAAGAALAALAGWAVGRWTPAPRPQPARLTIATPAAHAPAFGTPDRLLALSPDGSLLAYVAGIGPAGQITVRPIDQLAPVPLRGATGLAPFFSPDGKWVGFFAAGRIEKVSVTGGSAISLCRVTGFSRGASWGEDGTIVFATYDPSTGLVEVPASGGEPKVLTTPDTARGEVDHLFPSVLPGARAVLFTVASTGSQAETAIAALDRGTGQWKVLIRGGSDARYVDSGHLVYAAGGSLRAVRFDPARLEAQGEPVSVADQVASGASGAAHFAVSRNGSLAYVPRGGTGARTLVWVDRRGREEPTGAPPRAYAVPILSPDGTRVAVEVRDQEQDIWMWDLARATLSRLTFDAALDAQPVWTPDGRRVIFGSTRSGQVNVYAQAADGTGAVERLTNAPNAQFPVSVAPDGTRLALLEMMPKTDYDLVLLPLDGKGRAETLVQTPFREINAEISPDGHWLAYQSNESGPSQVYVRPFPDVNGGRWQISPGGGTRPVWAPNGRELFYLDAAGSLMSVPISTASTFVPGNAVKLFEGRYFTGTSWRTYDIARDGQRFLMIKDVQAADPNAMPPSIVVVLNWVEELRARVGGR